MGQSRLRLDYLPAGCELLGGDLVETSGLGGFYPSGLVIGAVEEVLVDDSGSASYAVLPAAEAPEGEPEEDGEQHRCEYVGENGIQCRNMARPGSRYCGIHEKLMDAEVSDDPDSLI